jgi:DNA-directed RNA polymerase specialized sigma24 family protein
MNAIVLFGDVIRSRRDAPGSTTWLRTLAAELEATYPAESRLADFEFTQGDEIQGLLRPDADPLLAVLRAWLHPERRRMRWVVVAGEVDPGTGPATQRTGPAFLRARERLADATSRRDGLLMSTDDPPTDRLLDDLAPILAELLADLTPTQRAIGRLLLVEGLRRSEAAERLNKARATVSVAAERAHLRSIGRLAGALRILFAAGTEAAARRAAIPEDMP